MNLGLTIAEKIVIAVIVVLILVIPAGAYILSQTIFVKQVSSLNSTPEIKVPPKEVAKTSPLQTLQDSLQNSSQSAAASVADTSSDTSVPEVNYGPTLSFKLNIEGRPSTDQSAKVFVGIAAGGVTNNPSYLLSFNVKVSKAGEYKGLSLAGLTTGNTYTAYIKGQSQIATASAFQVRTTVSDIGLLNLITGDLNEDNVIDDKDQALIKATSGATSTSSKWNAGYDFNLDGIINNFDLMLINKNFGKVGIGGAWYSRINNATKSAELNSKSSNIGGPVPDSSDGFWMWVPKF